MDEPAYNSETLRTLLRAAMKAVGCRDGMLFRCAARDEPHRFRMCACVMASPCDSDQMAGAHENGQWLVGQMRKSEPSIYNDATGLVPEGHPSLRDFAVVPLFLPSGARCGALLLGNRTEPFGGVADLRPAEPWTEVIASIMQSGGDLARAPEGGLRSSYQALEEAKALMQETKAMSDAKDTFLATMSHEIRTPLNGIMGMAEVLSHTQLSENQSECLEVISHCSVQLMELITDILEYSKMASNSLELHVEPFSVLRVVEEAHDVVRLRAEDKNLALTHYVDSAVPDALIGDSKRIKQILVNLLSNSVKFTEAGSVNTRVSWDGPSQTMSLKVCDTGVGVPRKDQERIFDTFVQLPNNTRGGTGLGLGIVDKLAKLMGGGCTLKSKSREDGHPASATGTKITIRLQLPPASRDDAGSACSRFSEKERDALRGRNVVVCEDDAKHRLTLVQCLLKLETTPCVCGSPQELRMYLEQRELDVFAIFVDTDNADARREFKEISRNAARHPDADPPTPVIKIISLGESTKEASQSNRRVLKPIKADKVYGILQCILDGTFPSVSPLMQPLAEALPLSLPLRLAGGTENVLIAEDNEDNQKVLAELLRVVYPSIVVAKAYDGEEAVRIACDPGNKFGLILMDIKMPRMDGFEATRRIRRELGKACPFIVAVTATVFENDRRRCIEAGMDAYISKPVQIRELKALLTVIYEGTELEPR